MQCAQMQRHTKYVHPIQRYICAHYNINMVISLFRHRLVVFFVVVFFFVHLLLFRHESLYCRDVKLYHTIVNVSNYKTYENEYHLRAVCWWWRKMIPYGIQTEVQVVDTMSCYMQTVHRHNKLFHRQKKTMVINFFWMHLLSSWHQTERFRPKCGHKYHNTCTSSHTKFTLWQSWHLPKACKSVFVLRHTSIQKIHHEKWCLFKFALKFNRFEPNEIVVIKRFVYFRKWNTWNKFVSRSMNSNDKLKINDKLM